MQDMVTDETVYSGPLGKFGDRVSLANGGWKSAWEVLSRADEQHAGYSRAIYPHDIVNLDEVDLLTGPFHAGLDFTLVGCHTGVGFE